MNTKLTRVVGAVSAAAIATLGFASAAFAADTEGANPGAIDPAAKGSITIHKAAGDPEKGNNDGSVWEGWKDQTPLPGAGFTMWTVDCGIDFTTNAGWTKLADLVATVGANPGIKALEGAGCTLTSQGQKLTDANGEIEHKDLQVGLYYFQETKTPVNYQTVLPFLVTVPMTNPEGNSSWMYDINVYPKDRDHATKTPSDGQMKPGALVDWTVKSPAPYYPAGTKSYQMTDLLDPSLEYHSTKEVFASAPDGTKTTFVRGTDYAIKLGTVGDQILVYMELTKAGRAKMDALVKDNPAISMNWTLTTKVLTLGENENEATIWENKPGVGGEGVEVNPPAECDPETEICEETGTTEPPVVTPEECDEGNDPECTTTKPPVKPECDPSVEDCEIDAITKWGGLEINKFEHGDEEHMLAGAEFSIYGSQKSAKDACDVKNATFFDKGVTDQDGKLQIMPLRYSDFADNEQLTEGDSRYSYYCAVETKAPAGYELLPEGIQFVVTADTVNGDYFVVKNVDNVKKNGGFELPLTGGIGTMIFIVAGGVLLVGAARMARRSSKVEA